MDLPALVAQASRCVLAVAVESSCSNVAAQDHAAVSFVAGLAVRAGQDTPVAPDRLEMERMVVEGQGKMHNLVGQSHEASILVVHTVLGHPVLN